MYVGASQLVCLFIERYFVTRPVDMEGQLGQALCWHGRLYDLFQRDPSFQPIPSPTDLQDMQKEISQYLFG